MTTLAYVRAIVIPGTYSLLPPQMNSPEATAMLLAIGFQESGFTDRRQMLGGPARSFWEFEPQTVRAVIVHRTTAKAVEELLSVLRYKADQVYATMADNDILACAFARLLLWTHPKPLPKRGETKAALDYYLDIWRPGKPRIETWDGNYVRAWELVT